MDELPPEERKSAMNEVNVLSMLQHPNIIAYYSSFVEEKSLMIAMEYAPGGTLYELIQERNGKLIEEEEREGERRGGIGRRYLKGNDYGEGGRIESDHFYSILNYL